MHNRMKYGGITGPRKTGLASLACPKTFIIITIIHCDKKTVCTYTVGDLAECEATSYKNRVIDTTAGC